MLERHYTTLTLLIAAGCVGGSLVSDRFLLPATIVIWILLAAHAVINRGFTRTPADLGILALLLMLPVTLWVSALPEITRPQVYRLLIGVGFYSAIVGWVRSRRQYRIIWLAIPAIGLALVLIGLLNTEWIFDKLPFLPVNLYAHLPQIFPDTIHPNILAGTLVILLPMVISLPLFAWTEISKPERFLFIFAALLMALILVLTQSRGALFALAAVLSVMLMLRWKNGWRVVLALAVLAAAALAIYGPGMIIDTPSISSDSAEKLAGRLEIWSRGLYMLQDFPISGVGMGLYGNIADTLYPFFLNSAGSVPHAHNLFLQIAVDLGMPGLIAWSAVFLAITYSAWRLYRENRTDRWLAGCAVGLLCSQVGLAVHGLLDAATWGMVKPAPLVWGLWGLSTAAWITSAHRPHAGQPRFVQQDDDETISAIAG